MSVWEGKLLQVHDLLSGLTAESNKQEDRQILMNAQYEVWRVLKNELERQRAAQLVGAVPLGTVKVLGLREGGPAMIRTYNAQPPDGVMKE